MKLLRSISPLACMAFMLATAPVTHADPIVTNGTFSGPSLSGWTASGSGTTPGQGITAINVNNDGYGDSVPDINGTSTGAFFVDDNASEVLSQDITLAADTSYSLTFDLFATQSGAANPYFFSLTDGVGTLASSTIGDGDLPVGVWTLETLNFTTVTAGPYDLNFDYMSGPTPAKDVILTNVAVAATPEPSSFILLGSGLLAAAGLVRRRLAV